MTMQVGMLGLDGVLLASDTLWSDGKNRSKFRINEETKIVVTLAGDMESAERVANAILQIADEPTREDIEQKILSVGNVEISNEDWECLAVFANTNPLPRLFYVYRSPDTCSCDEIETKALAGHKENIAARFWVDRYYGFTRSIKPIIELTSIGAQVIVGSATVNNGGIGGLEMILCKKNEIVRMDQVQINQFLIRAAEIHRFMDRSIMEEKR